MPLQNEETPRREQRQRFRKGMMLFAFIRLVFGLFVILRGFIRYSPMIRDIFYEFFDEIVSNCD